MINQRSPLAVPVLLAMAIFLLAATATSLVQTATTQVANPLGGAQVLTRVSDIVTPGVVYFIKSKGSQKVIDVDGGSSRPGTAIRQLTLDGTLGQKFIFTKAEDGFFFIRTSTGGHFVTLHHEPGVLVDPTVSSPPVSNPSLTQELLATNPLDTDGQKWKVVESGEPSCFLILNKTDETRALQPGSSSDRARLITVPRDGNNLQKWILKLTTEENNPDTALAEKGLVSDCFATFEKSFVLFTVKQKKNVSPIFPEWRSVGEESVVDGIHRRPFRSYKILEGVVTRNSPHVSPEDQPAGHFTHDFNFDVNPDPAFRYLLGKQNGVVQPDIEVEWESGLAQADSRDRNPASAASIRGDSFGFYTAGHKRRDVIWNWPTANDWVHVEGIWIFDRGHDDPVRTEIHPPQFVAVKRDLPDVFEPKPDLPGQFVFATRADIFANGDGNIVWNNKGLNDFAQPVKMSERVYTVIFKHDLPRPTPTAKLKFAFKNQPGNSYTGQPIVEVFENGTADTPTPHVMMSISWAGDRVPDTAVFAKTLFIYWDDLPTHGVRAGFEIKKVSVTFNRVVIQDKSEGDDRDPGEYRLFGDIGGKWIFLNEFTGASDIMNKGLGRAWDTTYSKKHPIALGPGATIPFPVPSGAAAIFNFNQPFDIYIPAGKSFRLFVGGWEGDYIEDQFGKVFNPYAPCADAINFAEKEFSVSQYKSDGGLDDPTGEATFFISFDSAKTLARLSFPSQGSKTEDPGIGNNDPNNNFRATFSVRVTSATTR